MRPLIFIIVTREILLFCRDGLQLFPDFYCLDADFPKGDEIEPNEAGLQFYDDLLTNASSMVLSLCYHFVSL